jgi:uncharacterized protein YndB with AHSA1/START domain
MAARNADEAGKNQTSMELEGDRGIVISRAFNGPARLVFEVWTKPELVKRWWAPRSLGDAIVSIDAEVAVGGRYRYVLRNRDGNEMAFSGKYTEVTPHRRLVYTQMFEPVAESGAPPEEAGAVIVTVTFDERDGKTLVVSRSSWPSKEVRDMVLATGMERGMRETMDQLEELVASLG